MKKKRQKNHIFEIVLVLAIFILVSLGSVFMRTDVKDYLNQEIAAVYTNTFIR